MNSSHSPHDSSSKHSFWHLVSKALGCVFGVAALVLGAGFIYGGIVGYGEVKQGGTASQGQASATASAAVPASGGSPTTEGGVTSIVLRPSPANPMTYDTLTFTVKAGQPVKLTFTNDSAVPLQHNVCVCKPGSKDAVMAEALKMMADPNGLAKSFVPSTPDILWHTKLVNPRESETLEFTPPAPGDYPYLCTFPGHTALMNGIMKAE